MSCGFSLFPLFSQNIPNKMISKKKKKKINIEKLESDHLLLKWN